VNIKFSVLCFGSGAKGVVPDETLVSSANASSSNQESHDVGTKSRVDDIWKKMNSGLPNKMPPPTMTKLSNTTKEKKNKPTNVSNVCCTNLSALTYLMFGFSILVLTFQNFLFPLELDDCTRPFA